MAYGIELNTILGTAQLTTQFVPRIADEISISGSSGSFTTSLNDGNSFVYTNNPRVLLDYSGSTVDWEEVFGDPVVTGTVINLVRVK